MHARLVSIVAALALPIAARAQQAMPPASISFDPPSVLSLAKRTAANMEPALVNPDDIAQAAAKLAALEAKTGMKPTTWGSVSTASASATPAASAAARSSARQRPTWTASRARG